MLENWATYLSVSPDMMWRYLSLNHLGSYYHADNTQNQNLWVWSPRLCFSNKNTTHLTALWSLRVFPLARNHSPNTMYIYLILTAGETQENREKPSSSYHRPTFAGIQPSSGPKSTLIVVQTSLRPSYIAVSLKARITILLEWKHPRTWSQARLGSTSSSVTQWRKSLIVTKLWFLNYLWNGENNTSQG